MAGIAVDYSFGDATKQLMNHDSFVFLRNRIKSLLDDMATEWVHGKAERISSDGLSNLYDLLWCPVFETALDEEVPESIDHEWISLGDDSFNNFILLLRSANFELLLQEDRSLLVVVADNFVHNVLPIAVDIAVKETAVVQWLSRRKIRWAIDDRLYLLVHTAKCILGGINLPLSYVRL